MLQILARRFRCVRRPFAKAQCLQHPSFTAVRPVTTLLAHPHAPSTLPRNRSPGKHVSYNAEGIELADLEFVKEPLGVAAEQGHGHLWIEFGDAIGPDRRYKIIRKLGRGMNASVWLVFDEKEKRYVAIKALKGYSTNLEHRGITWELAALERITSIPPPAGFTSGHCPQLLDHFTHPGRVQDGDHLCLVTDVLGGDVKSLQRQVKRFPLPLAKRILLHTLRGLAQMHSLEIVHTDLKHDNIMFDVGSLTQTDIAALVDADPPRRHPPEERGECTVQMAFNQPLPLPSLSEAMTRNYIVSDFGSAQPSIFHTYDATTAYDLRAPEIILQGPLDEKVDIWAFGCLIFEIIIGNALFEYKPYPKYTLDETMGHLWQMLCFTRERITREQITASKLGAQYFDLAVNPDDGDNPFFNLKAHPPIFNNPFALSLRNYKLLAEDDVLATAKIMQRCLRLNPNDRATAQELLQDSWWQGAA